MAEKDITEKTLESLNDVFADIVNGLLFQGEQRVQEDMLLDAQSFSSYEDTGIQRMQERDVAKYWVRQGGERINVRIAFLGIENQTNYDKDMVLRVIGYDGAAYRAELDGPDRYPVITLVLYFGDKPWGKNRSLYDVLDIDEKTQQYVSDYQINVFEIAFLPEESLNWFRSDFRVVVDYFLHVRNDPEYVPENPVKFQHTNELLHLMSALTQDNRFYKVIENEERRPEKMEKVLDIIEARGEARGLAKGEARGILLGETKTLTSLVKKGLISLADAANEMNLSPAEFEEKVRELENYSRYDKRSKIH